MKCFVVAKRTVSRLQAFHNLFSHGELSSLINSEIAMILIWESALRYCTISNVPRRAPQKNTRGVTCIRDSDILKRSKTFTLKGSILKGKNLNVELSSSMLSFVSFKKVPDTNILQKEPKLPSVSD